MCVAFVSSRHVIAAAVLSDAQRNNVLYQRKKLGTQPERRGIEIRDTPFNNEHILIRGVLSILIFCPCLCYVRVQHCGV